jgi:hypothetical protein
MRSMLCAAVAALAFILPAAPAAARTPVYARTKCVGLYCRIVTEPDPRPEPLPSTWRKGWAPRRAPKVRRKRPARAGRGCTCVRQSGKVLDSVARQPERKQS